MDVQIFLVLTLFLLVAVVVYVGIYLVVVLKDLRETIKKTNSVLGDVGIITKTFSNPLVYLVKILGSIAEGVKAVRSVTSIRDEKNEEK